MRFQPQRQVSSKMNSFVAWNLRLLQAFFSKASQNDEVWIAVDPEELEAIGPDLGGDQGFLSAVREGPPWPTIWRQSAYAYVSTGNTQELTERALGLLRQRKSTFARPESYIDPGSLDDAYEGHGAPNYIPFLAALVRCAALRGDDGGFYEGLQSSLGLSPAWNSGEMSALEPLWHDLQSWSGERGSPFGRFVYRQLGGYRYVGVPTSQSIVSRRDLKELTRIFAQAGVRAGQRVTDRLVMDVQQIASQSPYLSSPFAKALNTPAFSIPIRERLISLLEDWDGTVTARHGGSAADGNNEREARVSVDDSPLEIALALSVGNELPWQIQWCVPALMDVGSIALRNGSGTWRAHFSGTDSVIARRDNLDGSMDELSAKLLASSEHADVLFDTDIGDDDQLSRGNGRHLTLQRSILRTLVITHEWSGDSNRIVLRERPLPRHQGAYLLVSPGNVDRAAAWLSVHRPAHEFSPVSGLPANWVLIYIRDCAQLGDNARRELPDADGQRAQSRVVRFVGGRSVQRAGLRQYLSYDPPFIELDAPPGTTLEAAGLQLIERNKGAPRADWLPLAQATAATWETSGLRAFDIRFSSEGRSFVVRARLAGEVIGEAKLRLAPESGLAVSRGTSFRLDSAGNPTSSGHGMLGVIDMPDRISSPSIDSSRLSDVDQRRAVHMGQSLQRNNASDLVRSAAAKFLDSLASSSTGSLAYGSARDQLRRLAEDDSESNPALVLSDLRGRGLLEIETDAKGRWIRIHSVPPTLVVLPHLHHEGRVVACPVGTLRLQHWKELLASGLDLFWDSTASPSSQPPVWIAAATLQQLRSIAHAGGFQVAEQPALDIATWATSLADVEERLTTSGVEAVGHLDRDIERFVPAKGLFARSSSGAALDAALSCQLFRLDDPETGHHKLYTLGHRDAEGRTRYSFVRDSRWGVWLALASFARFAKKSYAVEDASPWPFHFDDREGTFWLPARINLPVVLERALILSSGAPPLKAQVSGTNAHGMRVMIDTDRKRAIGGVSRVYHDMIPSAPASSKWLGYRWVSLAVATLIARKLGGQVLPVRDA